MLGINDHEGELEWCVVQTEPRREQMVYGYLIGLGLSAYWPTYDERRRENQRSIDHRRVMRRSLFPSYIFAGFEAAGDGWKLGFRARGAIRVLGRDDRPSLIDRAFLWALMGREGELAHNLKRARWAFGAKPGDRVRVTEGPFAGLIGKLTALNDHGRVDLLLSVLGGPTPVRGLSVDDIEPAAAGAA